MPDRTKQNFGSALALDAVPQARKARRSDRPSPNYPLAAEVASAVAPHCMSMVLPKIDV
ncbi:hypothetical protein [Almyronema epifaneia]|uniref:Uncharacterized protein n=1 Tax=Almyronema epifaneia S1 TaxID=2991925 RepID=A0ABW6IJE1_9CYAN